MAPSRPVQTLALIAIAASSIPLHADRLVGTKRNELVTIDRQTGDLSDFVEIDPQIRAFPSSASAQTYHPTEGLHYLITGGSTTQQLVVFDSSTGLTSSACTIDEIAEHGASIDFGSMADGYPLYLVGGGSNPDPGAIYIVDTATGDAVDTGWATAGVGGHSIAFNSSDGYLYHFYNTSDGGGGSPGLEKINTDTGVITPVPLSGTVFGVCNGVAYQDGVFYVVQKSTKQLYSVTPAGVVSLLGTLPDNVTSLGSDGSTLFTAGPDSSIKGIDTTTATYSSSVAVTNGNPSTRFSMEALARDPTTGILYMVAKRNYPGDTNLDSIYQLDPLTGKLTNEVYLSVDSLSGFVFLPDGTLYATSEAFNPPGPNELTPGTIATVNLSNGSVTALPWPTTLSNGRPQVLAYNDNDGKIYRVYRKLLDDADEVFMEAIDTGTGVPSPVGFLDGLEESFTATPFDMTYDSKAELFYLAAQSVGVHAVTPQAEYAQIADSSPRFYGLEIEPDLEITSFSVNGTASIDFKSVSGREYGLYSTTNLIDWEPVTGFDCITATPPVNTASGVALPSAEKGFFRLGPPVSK